MRKHMVPGVLATLLALLLMNCAAMAGKSMELRSANTYFNQGDVKQALDWYEKADAKGTGEAQVYARLVEIYAEQKRWPEMSRAFAKIDQCLDKEKDRSKYKEEASIVIDQLWMGLWNGSIEQTHLAEENLAAGDSAAVVDHFRQARDRIATALEILPDHVEFHKRMGDLYITEFNSLHADQEGFPLLQKAAESYAQLVAAYPDSVDYAIVLTQLHYNSRHYDQARATVDEALRHNKGNADLLNYAGKVRIQQGLALKDAEGAVPPEGRRLMSEAITFLDDAIELNPNDPMLVYNLALLYRDMEEPHQAIKTFNRIEALAGDRPDLLFDSWYSMAVLYFQDLPEEEQDPAKAAEYFEKCLGLQPDNAGLKFNLGVSLIRTGDKDKIVRGKALMSDGQ